jgi:tetratricopeptide (TPR) repeat protein
MYKSKYVFILLFLLFWGNLALGQINKQQEVDDARARYIEGITAFENEDYHEAVQLLGVAYIHLSDMPGVNFALADAYLQIDDLANAEYYAQQAVRLDPQNKWYHLKLAEIHQYNENHEASIKELNVALKYYPDDRELLFRLAQALTQVGRLHEANEIYDRLIALEGEEISLYLQKLHNFNELGMADSVGVVLEQIRSLDPDNVTTLQVLSNYYMKMDRADEALEVLDDAQRLDSRNPQLLNTLIDAHLSAERWNRLDDRLSTIFSDSVIPVENKLIAAKHLHRRFEENNRHPSLRQVTDAALRELIKAEPESEQVQELGVTYFLQTGQQQTALEVLERSTELIPKAKKLWQRRLQLLIEMGETREAIYVGEEARIAVPGDIMILYYLGSAYLEEDNPAGAVNLLKKAAELAEKPDFKAHLLALLGDSYSELGHWNEAFESYEKSLSLNPDNVVVLNNYAYFLSQQRQKLDKAEQLATQAVKAEPDNPSFLDTLGWIYFQKGDYELARKYIKKALQYESVGPEVMEHMGDVMAKLDQPRAAKYWWNKALRIDSTRTDLKKKIENKD